MENQNSSFGNYSFSTALALIFSKTSAIKSSILDSNLRPSQNKNHKKLSHLPSSKIWFLSCRKWKWWWTYYRPLSIYRENNVQDTQPHLKWPNTGRGWGSYFNYQFNQNVTVISPTRTGRRQLPHVGHNMEYKRLYSRFFLRT